MFSAYLWGIETNAASCWGRLRYWFSAYLWGIETIYMLMNLFKSLNSFQHTYEGLKPGIRRCWIWPLWVFSIPMRDWNYPGFIEQGHRIPFSAYLWGIETQESSSTSGGSFARFQHTYEGLKLPILEIALLSYGSFQHTYEGLKHLHFSPSTAWISRFQHTYEGLKRRETEFVTTRSVPFSAYLWGIETLNPPESQSG